MTDPTIATVILMGGFALLMVLRVPITFSLALASIATATYLNIPLMAIVQQMVQGVKSFSLLAIP
ncbi:MAG: TRAP transporter large permease subunit, partial [Spirochaetota bacterium]